MYCITLRNKFDKTIIGWYDASASNFSTDQRRAKHFFDRVDADLVADQLRRMYPRLAQDIEVTAVRGTQQEALAILLEVDFLQPIEIAQDVAPFGGNPVPVEPIFEFLGEQEREKRAEHMAANGDVAAVVDRTGGEDGLGLAQQLLDAQQVAVTQHDLQRGDLGIGAQHVEPMERASSTTRASSMAKCSAETVFR